MCQKLWSDYVWFLKYGTQWTDGQTDGHTDKWTDVKSDIKRWLPHLKMWKINKQINEEIVKTALDIENK